MYTSLIRPLLFYLDPEKAHHISAVLGNTLCSIPLAGNRILHRYSGRWPQLQQDFAGVRFPNPVGIAAGYDKNAEYPELLRFLGFGYAEYGSITAHPSSGNPRPRLFRLKVDRGLINRMGLNNEGAEKICRRLRDSKADQPGLFEDFPCGINIAKTHDPGITGDDAIRDYITSYRHARDAADYITLNVSCPNTREGKTFEDKTALRELLDGIMAERRQTDPPILVKFSPDTSLTTFDELVAVCEDRSVHGYVLSNTSSQRNRLKTSGELLDRIGAGGLSGAPLYQKTLKRIEHMRNSLSDEKLLIACGGIDTPDKAIRMISAGANLLQIYTGLVYEGPSLVPRINDTLARRMNEDGLQTLNQWPRI